MFYPGAKETAMADAESGQSGGAPRSISNTMGAIVIAVLLIVGGVIIYQGFQLKMAISVLNMMAEDIAARNKK